MATIKSQMTLNDGMSEVLKKITRALDITLASFEQMQRASGEAIDTHLIEEGRGLLVEVNHEFDQIAESCRQAAQEEKRLNQNIHEGASAMDGLMGKVTSVVAAYASIGKVKSFAMDALGTADVQIGAQVQLKTVLNNMGAEESYQALVDEASGNALEDTLTLNTAGAVSNYETLVDMADGTALENTLALGTSEAAGSYTSLASGVDSMELGNTLTLGTSEAESSYTSLTNGVDGAELENTLTLGTNEAQAAYTAFAEGVDGNLVTLTVQADATQATSAYDAILAKASEIQGRGMYGDEAMIAGAAEFATYFSDTEAILSMMDTLTNYAAGMSSGGAVDASAMVDYATGLGKIMSGSYDAMTKKGFKFSEAQKAIIEGAATEAQIVAELGEEYLGMSQDMQAAAVIEDIISEGWGGMYEAMSNTPFGLITQLNNALGDVQENVGAGIYPAVLDLVQTVQNNLPQIETAAMGLATVLGFAITILTGMTEGAISFGAAVADNWGWISPIIAGVGAALLIYNGYLMATNTLEAISNGLKAVAVARSVLRAGKTLAEAAATTTATGAQVGLNAALLACPVTWIVVGIIAFIAVLYAAVGAVNHFAGTSVSATGLIAGAFATLFAHVANNTVIPMWNLIATFVNFLGNAFHDPIAAIKVTVLDMCLAVIGYIKNLAAGIESLLNKIPGVTVDITGGLDSFYSKLEQAQQAVKDESGWVEYVQKRDFIDYRDAASAGYEFGQGVEDKMSGFFGGLGYTPSTMDDLMEKYGNIPGRPLNDLSNDVGVIADNTGGMAHALEVSGEELKYLRDIAERDAINRFTTAEVKIDMTGMTNKIDGGTDLDGVIRELTDGFSEALVTAAEEVHE